MIRISFLFFAIDLVVTMVGCSSAAPPSTNLVQEHREGIRKVIKENLEDIKFCYDTALKSDPKLSGQLVVQWKIVMEGKVSEPHVKSKTLNSPPLEECVVEKFKKWKFPAPPSGVVDVVSYPFVFQREK